MSGYIDKDALISILNAKAALAMGTPKDVFITVARMVNLLPAADVVEVVYCRDCKHNQDNGGDCNRTMTHTSRDLVCEVNEYKYIGLEYCSYGQRREK